MMGRALLTVGAMATLGLFATGVLGYLVADVGSAGLHVLIALASCLLLLFSHCWIMFYLIGTGKAIKQAVADDGLSPELVEETKAFKNRSYPSLMLAMALAMATFILGGGVDTGSIPAWFHQAMFLITLAVQFRTLWIEHLVLLDNAALLRRVEALAAVSSAQPATGSGGRQGGRVTGDNVVLSGMRSTGKLHLGNYFGAVRNWVELQDRYDCYYFVADWHALTTDYADPSQIAGNTLEVVADYLASGLDPERSVIFVQSLVPEHAELHLLLSMITPLGWLERVPTYKEQIRELDKQATWRPSAFSATRCCRRPTSSSTAPTSCRSARTRRATWSSAARSAAASTASTARSSPSPRRCSRRRPRCRAWTAARCPSPTPTRSTWPTSRRRSGASARACSPIRCASGARTRGTRRPAICTSSIGWSRRRRPRSRWRATAGRPQIGCVDDKRLIAERLIEFLSADPRAPRRADARPLDAARHRPRRLAQGAPSAPARPWSGCATACRWAIATEAPG